MKPWAETSNTKAKTTTASGESRGFSGKRNILVSNMEGADDESAIELGEKAICRDEEEDPPKQCSAFACWHGCVAVTKDAVRKVLLVLSGPKCNESRKKRVAQ